MLETSIFQVMAWQHQLTKREAEKLARLEQKRKNAREKYNALRLVLKSRAEARQRSTKRGKPAD